MENPKTIEEVISQAKKIEGNIVSSMEHFASINMLMASNDLARSKNKGISSKVNELNKKMEDINKLTSDLLNDLVTQYN